MRRAHIFLAMVFASLASPLRYFFFAVSRRQQTPAGKVTLMARPAKPKPLDLFERNPPCRAKFTAANPLLSRKSPHRWSSETSVRTSSF